TRWPRDWSSDVCSSDLWASTGLLALLICLTLRRTGDLRFAIGFHAAFDFGAIFVYSGPNGGRLAPDRLLTATFHGADWLTGGKRSEERRVGKGGRAWWV